MRGTGGRATTTVTSLVAGAVLLAGCTSQVGGAAETGGPGSTLPTGTAAVLDRIPASAGTTRWVVVSDPVTLNRVDQRSGFPATAETGRPAADVGYLDVIPVLDDCAALDSRPAVRSVAPGPGVTVSAVRAGSRDDTAKVAVCGGAADPALLASELDDGGSSPTTVDGISGRATDEVFIGADAADNRTLVRRGDADPDVFRAAVGGAPSERSLLRDPDVATVLGAMPRAALVVLGTDLLGVSRSSAPGAVVRALDQVAERSGGDPPPVPEFAGFGWVPSGALVGSTVFVTSYGSDQEAATATALLTGVWQELGESRFSGASTVQQGSTVVTTVPETGPRSFEFQQRQVVAYPGFLARG